MAVVDKNKEIVRRYFDECWNLGNLALVDELFSQDCRFHDPVFPMLGPGADDVRRQIMLLRDAFPDFKSTIHSVIAENDDVVVHWTVQGTHEGRFLGLAPTHRPMKVSGTSIFLIRDGKIIEKWAEWNLLLLLEQLGVAIPGIAAARVQVSAP